EGGFANLLLPSGYAMGIDSVAFASAIATLTRRIQLLVAVRMGEMWAPQLARQLATIDQITGGRLTINIISSELPGQPLASAQRYGRTLEIMRVLRTLLNGDRVGHPADFLAARSIHPRTSRPRAGGHRSISVGLSEAAR